MESDQTETTQNETTQSEQSAQGEQTSQFTVPESYADRGWAKDLKSNDDVWKLLDNAQSLIGKRPAGIPSNDASDEEWEKFFQAARPEQYEFTEIEGLPEGVDLSAQTEKASELFKKYGLTQKQADGLRKEWLMYEMSTMGEHQQALDKQFDELTSKHFDNLEEAQKLTLDAVNKYVPEEMRPHVQALENNPQALVGLISLATNMQKEISEIKEKYGAEGSLTHGQSTSAANLDEVRKELAQLRVSDAARNFDHPEHKQTHEKINQLSQTVRRMIK